MPDEDAIVAAAVLALELRGEFVRDEVPEGLAPRDEVPLPFATLDADDDELWDAGDALGELLHQRREVAEVCPCVQEVDDRVGLRPEARVVVRGRKVDIYATCLA